MFATLIGTNRNTNDHIDLATKLCEIAIALGFAAPDTELRVRPDQISLADWHIEQFGPSSSVADFLLAVTSPVTPSNSPIPAKQTVSGPLFSVTVMPTYFGVYSEVDDEYTELKSSSDVLDSFRRFVTSVKRMTSEMEPDVFSFYVESLFLGEIECSVCRTKLKEVSATNDPALMEVIAHNAVRQGWRHSTANDKPATLCPPCSSAS